MRQLLLDWGAEQPQTLSNFVIGKNEELAQHLDRLSLHAIGSPMERFVYLWGESGAGKTHILRALTTGSGTRYIPADAAANAFLFDPDVRVYAVDDCEKLPADAQIAAFALFNQVRENDATLVTVGSVAPAALSLREDLRTRLGWGLIYQIHGLTDEEKIDALSHAAHARGFALAPGVLPYLITHFRRDMRSLSTMLDALDRYSLETQRPITLPLLRSLLQLEGTPKA